MRRVDSLYLENCSWCKEVREKYSLRAKIAARIGLQKTEDFKELTTYGCCPFHKLLTCYPDEQKHMGKFSVTTTTKDGKVFLLVNWYSNKHNYALMLDLSNKTVIGLIKDKYGYFSLSTNVEELKELVEFSDFEYLNYTFNFDNITTEILMIMGKSELEELESKIIFILQDYDKEQLSDDVKKGLEIIERLIVEGKDSEHAKVELSHYIPKDRIQKAISIPCNYSSYTKVIQGYFKYNNNYYFKRRAYVALLNSQL